MDTVRSGTLIEVGNIILNAIMGTVSNMLEYQLNFSQPEYTETRQLLKSVLYPDVKSSPGFVVLANASFMIKELEIKGNILIVFQLGSIGNLKMRLEKTLKIM